MEALKLKRKTVRSAFTRLFNHLDESAKTEANIADDLDCLATFQLLGEKNNELLQLNEDILNLLMSEEINEDDIEKESRSAGNQKSVLKCAFCDKNNHESKECHVARNLDLSEKMNRLKKRGCCFRCLSNGHVSKLCRVQVNCGICGQRHHAVMCPDRKTVESSNSQEATESSIH
ncbi:hypothetical protein HNY73_006691 [Argiope bruennichi]|uniref:CCHC-type domain-containing protein n=1 Tax=Argiope bruennichi TaxID=94029 RepID=A0A8T0FE55_ARGBR|nr:hypothetical protein HNY73_006691 [Argiope bruennichi]